MRLDKGRPSRVPVVSGVFQGPNKPPAIINSQAMLASGINRRERFSMIDRDTDIQTADGAMNTFVTHPEEGGPHPVVMFLMDAPGGALDEQTVRAELEGNICRCTGYHNIVKSIQAASSAMVAAE